MAAAVSLFGLHSGTALTTVVGVLVKVAVILSVVRIVTATRDSYEALVDPFGLVKVEPRREVRHPAYG